MPPKYPVDRYFTLLRAAGRSEDTIKTYQKALLSYARSLNVPLDDIHNHLEVDNLLKFVVVIKSKAPSSQKTILNILRRYFSLNGVEFDPLEFSVINKKTVQEINDKPISLETLQQMMDLTNVHGRAMLSFLVSTGCRAGEFCQLLLSDVDGDVVTIRNEIAKGGRGGKVYLTSEAREYLDLWLREREQYLKVVDARSKSLMKMGILRPKNDNRIFGVGYASFRKWFTRLYMSVDGERGKYGNMCTPHSCRKYFRTHAVKTMSLDLVENLMRHTGYLNSAYVRTTEEERRSEFHAGENILYLTRADHRITTNAVSSLKKELADVKEQMALQNSVIDAIRAGKIKLVPYRTKEGKIIDEIVDVSP